MNTSCYTSTPTPMIFKSSADCGTCETKIEQDLDLSYLQLIYLKVTPATEKILRTLEDILNKKLRNLRYAQKATSVTRLAYAGIVSTTPEFHLYIIDVMCKVSESQNSKEQNSYELSASLYLANTVDGGIVDIFKSIATNYCDVKKISPFSP